MWSTPINDRDLVQTSEIPFDNYFIPSTNQEHVSLTSESVYWLMDQLDGNYYNVLGGMDIFGSNIICDRATYYIENLLPEATVQWSLSNDNLKFAPAQVRDCITLLKNGNGYCDITANITLPNNEEFVLTKTVWAGEPRTYIQDIVTYSGLEETHEQPNPDCCGSVTLHPGERANIILYADGFTKQTQWIADIPQTNVCQIINSGSNITIVGREPGVMSFSTKATNECGEGFTAFVVVSVVPNSSFFSVSPNPAYTLATVALNGEIFTKNDNSSYEIQVWNSMGLIDTYHADQPTYQISVSHLPEGIYFVHVIMDGQTYTEKLIVK